MNNIPLTEKYRPNKIEDLMLNNELKYIIENILKLKKIPNLILYGPPGTGKTSTALFIAKSIINKKNYKECILEINASDNRCLDDVENKIYNFCRKKTFDIKIIIMDEAEIITKKALRIIDNLLNEKNINNTNFIFTCNSKKNIIESI